MMKKFLYIAVCIAAAVSVFGCTPSENEQNDVNTEQGAENTEFADSVKEYFPTDDLYRVYNGYAEAGFEIKYDGTEENSAVTVYKYEGAMNDERGGSEDGDRTFYVTYTVSEDSVVEHVENSDYMAESKNRLYSAIADQVKKKKKIEEGNSWEQEVELDGKTVTAVTTITEVDDESFQTVLEAEADGYKDGKYTEQRTYTKLKGLTSFSNTPKGSDEDDTLIFGYGYSIDNKQSITGMI